jgi:hypothetical protein
MPDARCTRSLVRKGRKHTSSHHRSAENSRHSLRDGFNGLYRALPGDRACLPPSPLRSLLLKRLDASIGASGPHGFAVRNKRFRPAHLRAPDAVASTASHPNVRDDHDTPLWRGGMATNKPVIWVGWKQKYFSAYGWTAQISLNSLEKLAQTHTRFRGS